MRTGLNPSKMMILAILSFAILSQEAFARKGKREDFNFGLSVRMIDSKSDQKSTSSEDSSSKSEQKSTVLNPYVGWVFAETLNLGLTMHIDNNSRLSKSQLPNGTQSFEEKSVQSTQGYLLFTRLLFAKVMYFEGGGGFYRSTISTESSYIAQGSDGNYLLTKDSRSNTGMGLGYHAGVGFEIPFVNDFFLSSAYMFRSYSLRDVEKRDQINPIKNVVKTSELSFGLNHYMN